MKRILLFSIAIFFILSIFVFRSKDNDFSSQSFNAEDLKNRFEDAKLNGKLKKTNRKLLSTKEIQLYINDKVLISTYKFKNKEDTSKAIGLLKKDIDKNNLRVVFEKENLIAIYDDDNGIILSILNHVFGKPVLSNQKKK